MPYITRNNQGEITQKFENLQHSDQEYIDESNYEYKLFAKRGNKSFSEYKEIKLDELRQAKEQKLETVSLGGTAIFDADNTALLRLEAAYNHFDDFTASFGMTQLAWRMYDNTEYLATKGDLKSLILLIFKQEYVVRTKVYPAVQKAMKDSLVEIQLDIYLQFFKDLDLSGLDNPNTDLNKNFDISLNSAQLTAINEELVARGYDPLPA
jgi:hypothetical protein